ncbi:flagellar basal body P-ring formation chaperone FlgA [Rhizobium glycinendophyticum]|uniref:Flagella basal body P-ring formation protein FlgA n=1 Tax=Rhizobium glycinendophyticum TaxID=2589807 RepID=A0A504U4F8_9HYPH|nr:flagellar basal body P-ring formation protein FlgA [Rhizobium glycinendophyticum]
MKFRQLLGNMARRVVLAAGVLCFGQGMAFAQGTAVVPTRVIYPGETVSADQLNVVAVTNPNLSGGYARTKDEVVGMVTKRTLLPGRTIPTSSLREAFAVKRGGSVRLTFSIGNMLISASGTPLADASVGELIKVRNLDSGTIVSGTVMADGTVQVMAK